MLRKAGRQDLIDAGFDIDHETLLRSRDMSRDPDHAIYHALFDRGAPHAARMKGPEGAQPPTGPTAPTAPIRQTAAQTAAWIQVAILILIFFALCATRAKAQNGPARPAARHRRSWCNCSVTAQCWARGRRACWR